MTSILRRSGALLISVGLLVGPLSATSAEAAGTCTIVAPSRVTVVSLETTVTTRLGKDCTANGFVNAEWDLRHQYWYKREGSFTGVWFPRPSVTTRSFDFYDTYRMGTYDLTPYSASTDTGRRLQQNKKTVVIRYGSRLGLTSSRSGSYVTLKAVATRYGPYVEHFIAWKSKPVAVQYRTSTGSWKTVKTVTSNSKGAISLKLKASSTRSYRAVTADQTNSWGRTSNTVRR